MQAPDDEATRMKGRYRLTEDGEGGRSCALTLTDERTIGGYAVEADDGCIRTLAQPWFCGRGDRQADASDACVSGSAEDVFAWFVGEAGRIVLIDAARQPLFRLQPWQDGLYMQRRDGEGREALLLMPDDKKGDRAPTR